MYVKNGDVLITHSYFRGYKEGTKFKIVNMYPSLSKYILQEVNTGKIEIVWTIGIDLESRFEKEC